MNRDRIVYSTLLALVSFWCSLIFLAPVLGTLDEWGRDVSAVLYEGFSRVCHQLDARSLHMGEQKLGVCARCSAIYLAFLAGLIMYPRVHHLGRRHIPDRRWLVLALLPMAIDVALHYTGFHPGMLWTRLLTGGIAGIILPFFILPVTLDAAQKLIDGRTFRLIQRTERNVS